MSEHAPSSIITVAERLHERFVREGIFKEYASREHWYDDNWIRGFLFRIKIPLFPIHSGKDVLQMHDLHHIITGYGTDLKGELQLVAWELGCDGIGNSFLRILHRLFFLPFCLLLFPKASVHAYLRGRRCRSFFKGSPQKILDCNLADIKRRLEQL